MGIISGFLIMKNSNTNIIYKKPLTNQHNIMDTLSFMGFLIFPFFINSVRVKPFRAIRISRLIYSLWIGDVAISLGFISLSRRQYTLMLLIILWFKESSHLKGILLSKLILSTIHTCTHKHVCVLCACVFAYAYVHLETYMSYNSPP